MQFWKRVLCDFCIMHALLFSVKQKNETQVCHLEDIPVGVSAALFTGEECR